MRDAGHRTPDIGHRTAKKAKIIYPPPRGVDIIIQIQVHHPYALYISKKNSESTLGASRLTE